MLFVQIRQHQLNGYPPLLQLRKWYRMNQPIIYMSMSEMGGVHRLRTTLKTFYLKERALWKHARMQRRTLAQFEQFIDTWNETAKQMEKLEQMGLSFQSELRNSLKEQSDFLSEVGVTVDGLTLTFQKQSTRPHSEWGDRLQAVKVQLYQNYHQLFTLTFEESSSPYEQGFAELQGLIYEKRG